MSVNKNSIHIEILIFMHGKKIISYNIHKVKLYDRFNDVQLSSKIPLW